VVSLGEEPETELLQCARGTEHDAYGGHIAWAKPPGEQHLVYQVTRPGQKKTEDDGHIARWFVAAVLMIEVPRANAPSRQQA
jgi:hypothetical protein